MVRNFMQVKSFPLKPGRSWRNRIGAPSDSRTRSATKSRTGERITSAQIAAERSKNLFMVAIDYMELPEPAGPNTRIGRGQNCRGVFRPAECVDKSIALRRCSARRQTLLKRVAGHAQPFVCTHPRDPGRRGPPALIIEDLESGRACP